MFTIFDLIPIVHRDQQPAGRACHNRHSPCHHHSGCWCGPIVPAMPGVSCLPARQASQSICCHHAVLPGPCSHPPGVRPLDAGGASDRHTFSPLATGPTRPHTYSSPSPPTLRLCLSYFTIAFSTPPCRKYSDSSSASKHCISTWTINLGTEKPNSYSYSYEPGSLGWYKKHICMW